MQFTIFTLLFKLCPCIRLSAPAMQFTTFTLLFKLRPCVRLSAPAMQFTTFTHFTFHITSMRCVKVVNCIAGADRRTHGRNLKSAIMWAPWWWFSRNRNICRGFLDDFKKPYIGFLNNVNLVSVRHWWNYILYMTKVKFAQNFLPYFVQYNQPLSSLINMRYTTMSAKDFKWVNKHSKYDINTVL
jgi:hypothetical protein